MIFDTISVKARWERWESSLRTLIWGLYMHEKKGIFCRTESVAMTPKSRDHKPTTSLWGVAAKWPTRASKTKLILCPRDRPQGYSRISLSLSGRFLKEYRNIATASKQTPLQYSMGFAARIALTEVLATQMGVMRRSKKVSSFELYKLNPLSPHCGSIARELVHCYTWGRLRLLQFAA